MSTNNHTEYMDLVMQATLGKDWQNFFDLCLANSRKPLFQRGQSPFYLYDGKSKNHKGKSITDATEMKESTLNQNKVMLEGN